jgi:multiple sugar transport system ATP-binding protein
MTMATRIAVIKDGILQQVDTPQTLYETPANVFVAGFIGSPAMNFFKAKLEQSNGKLIVNAGDFQVELPDEKKDVYGGHVGKDLVFGIRPEDVHDPNFAPPGIVPSMVEATVDVTELMGNEIFVHFMAGTQELMGRVDPRAKMSIGDKVQIAFNMKNMHLFETEGLQIAIR